MSGKMMGRVMRAKIGSPTGKAVLTAYAYHADDNGRDAYPAQETVAEMTELKIRAVQEWTATLVKQGYLIPAGTKGHKSRNYHLNLAMLAPTSDEKDAPGAGFEDEKPAPGAPFQEKPAPGAGNKEEPEKKPAPGAQKPAPGARNLQKPAPGAQKPAPGAGETVRNSKDIKQEETEEESAATPAAPAIIDARRAERIFTEVTGMVSIPGGLDEQELILGKICSLADQHGSRTIDYLRPFYLAQIHTNNRSGRAYSKTGHFWLTEWAIAGELPDYVKQQLRSKFKSLPPALVEWMLERDRAQAGITTGPGSNGNGKGNDPLHVYGEDIARAAEELGLVKRKGANA